MTLARLGLFAIALASACDWEQYPYCEGEGTVAAPEDEPASPRARVVAQVLPTESSAVDILFVIDDSKSMEDEQQQLGIWSSEMFDVLSSAGELPDLHVGVISSSVAIAGLLQCETGGDGAFHVGAATLTGKDRFLSDVAGPDGTRIRNYSGTLTENFAKMALVGDGGCGLEQPFKAAQLSLGSRVDQGFLRDDALLLVVFVTDEDDCSSADSTLFVDSYTCEGGGRLTSYRCFEQGVVCYDGKGSRSLGERNRCQPNESSSSVQSVASFAQFVKGLKKDPAQVVVAAIYGKPNHIEAIPDEKVGGTIPRLANVCGDGGDEGTGATPAVRLNAFLAEFGGRASQSSICDSDLSWAMRDAGLITRDAATRSHCLRGRLADDDLLTPGIQPRCRVEVRGDVRQELLRCRDANETGCFTVEDDPACKGTETHLAFHVRDRETQTLTVSCDTDR